jgi:DNA-binding NarL/FixJ family response regulator
MNPFAGLGEELKERPGHAYTESVKTRRRGTRPVCGRPPRQELPVVDNPWGLSPSQCAVLQMLCDGRKNDEMAALLGVGRDAIELYLRLARQKMECSGRVTAALMWDRFARKAA